MDLSELARTLAAVALQQRIYTMEMAHLHGPLHVGGDLSASDILTVLFQNEMNLCMNDLSYSNRDRFVLSKGHGAGALYIAMALRGYYSIEDLFDTYMEHGSRFGLHPCKESLPALECSSGSLGHGLSIAVGMSMAAKMDGLSYRVFCLIGDGELAEGSIWEAVMAAAQFKLDNLIAIIDFNKITLDGFTKDIMNVEPLVDKFQAFNWHTVEVNGNSIEELLWAFNECKNDTSGKPKVIVAHTIKGFGVSFMENDPLYHSATLSDEDKNRAIDELKSRFGEAAL